MSVGSNVFLTPTDLCSHNDYIANLITTSTEQYNYKQFLAHGLFNTDTSTSHSHYSMEGEENKNCTQYSTTHS